MTTSQIALGCMGMSPGVYGAAHDDAQSTKVIHAAIERGITLLDTGDFYGMGHNELLVGQAIKGKRDKVQLSVKFGAQRGPDGAFLGFDGRPAAVKTALSYSLVRLGVDYIDIYRPARLDPNVPIEDTVGAVNDLIKAGFVRQVALSEVGVETIRRAAKVAPIHDLQIEYAIISRDPEDEIFPALRELGISATMYGVLSRGLLSGSAIGAKGDSRAHLPRFQGDNKGLVEKLHALAKQWHIRPGQLAIGYVMGKQPGFYPTLGMRTMAQLDEATAAKPLTAAQIAEVEQVAPRGSVVGTRYPAVMMKTLDSEKR
ncbi:MAG: aldo/keto reductase [Kofleriaceae bacterium]